METNKMVQRPKLKRWNYKTVRKHSENFYDIGSGNNFLVMTPKAQAIKVKIDKLDCIEIKTTLHLRTQWREWKGNVFSHQSGRTYL